MQLSNNHRQAITGNCAMNFVQKFIVSRLALVSYSSTLLLIENEGGLIIQLV